MDRPLWGAAGSPFHLQGFICVRIMFPSSRVKTVGHPHNLCLAPRRVGEWQRSEAFHQISRRRGIGEKASQMS